MCKWCARKIHYFNFFILFWTWFFMFLIVLFAVLLIIIFNFSSPIFLFCSFFVYHTLFFKNGGNFSCSFVKKTNVFIILCINAWLFSRKVNLMFFSRIYFTAFVVIFSFSPFFRIISVVILSFSVFLFL